jgi:nucleotide-binding universal stress UspA family protein
MTEAAPHLLIAYDGSDPAAEAIAVAARLFAGARATVLYAWDPMPAYPAVAGAPLPVEDDHVAETRAVQLAECGARTARSLGLLAEARAETVTQSAWRTVVDAAERDGADLVVMGTRGLSGMRAVLMGSLSHHVAQHALCPVLIVPDADVGDARRALAAAG